jgi:hypothetical protein
LKEKSMEEPEVYKEDLHKGRPDRFNPYMVAKLGCPEGWRCVVLDCSPEVAPAGYAKIEGAVCPADPEGGVNWRKRTKGTERTFFVKFSDLDRFNDEVAAAQGKCWKCWGTGKETASVGVRGYTYRICSKCKGTGKPQAEAAQV